MPTSFLSAGADGGHAFAAARAAGQFVAFAYSRLRLGTDGEGVTTLVCGFTCPLRCRYCLNPQSWCGGTRLTAYTAGELYALLRPDSLYFRSTGGGVTFGGGEPLAQADFYPAFRALCGSDWRLNLETSLQAEPDVILALAPVIDHWIVDVKDPDPARYRAYTGGESSVLLRNLGLLLGAVGPDRVTVRLPLIPDFNTESDRAAARESLTALGVRHFDLLSYRKGTRPF